VSIDVSKLLSEYSGVDLGDGRLDERLVRILPKLAADPSGSFPDQMGSDADQEALYRFLGNKKVTLEALLEGHRDQTLERISCHRLVRIAHDTSEFTFDGDRDGLHAKKSRGRSNFYAHFALATVADDSREPLGVVGVRPFVNAEPLDGGLTTAQRSARKRATPRHEKKSSRWEKLAIDVDNELPAGVEAIHLMDQEADDYNVFCALRQAGLRFVIRVDARRLTAENIQTDEFLADKPAQLLREVQVSVRKKKRATRQHPIRSERMARLSVRASKVTLRRPRQGTAELEEITISAVHVFEASPPADEPPIEWMLFTSEPVDTLVDIAAVVDHYRGRWIIEEYFKSLKTGCAFEKRQLGSFDALVRALGLLVPMAWTLLALRTIGRGHGDRKATHVFSKDQIRLLNILLKKRGRKVLPAAPTVRDAMLGVAALGGHIKNNGDPGWIVLGRGLQRLFEAEEIWLLLQEEM
jgi:Transposase DNA-binding/Transposase DDE domain